MNDENDIYDVIVYKSMRLRPSIWKRENIVLTKLQMIGEYEVCDVNVYESMRLRPFTRRRENSVFKSIHFGKRFRMYAFRRTWNAVYVWTQGVNVLECMRLQAQTYTCGRGLDLILIKNYFQFEQCLLGILYTKQSWQNHEMSILAKQLDKQLSNCSDSLHWTYHLDAE